MPRIIPTHWKVLEKVFVASGHIVKSIIRQAGLNNKEFFDLLNR